MRRASIVVDGSDLFGRFGLRLTNGSTFAPPEPKTYTVDIPGGNGVIDLTEALTGDVAYGQREMKLVLAATGVDDAEDLRRRLYSFLHGRRLGFSLTSDPCYTYTGRFAVTSCEVSGHDAVTAKVTVTCDPYKLKERCAYRLNATGGKMYRFESGRRPVHPTIECESVCFVTWEGETITVPAGTYVLRDVVFREGFNELYVNTQPLWLEAWGDLAEGGKDQRTWAGCASMRWDDLQRLGVAEDAPQDWAALALTRWADIGEGGGAPRRWGELDYRRGDVADSTAYLTYDWEDL